TLNFLPFSHFGFCLLLLCFIKCHHLSTSPMADISLNRPLFLLGLIGNFLRLFVSVLINESLRLWINMQFKRFTHTRDIWNSIMGTIGMKQSVCHGITHAGIVWAVPT